jgi:hypothetical protein
MSCRPPIEGPARALLREALRVPLVAAAVGERAPVMAVAVRAAVQCAGSGVVRQAGQLEDEACTRGVQPHSGMSTHGGIPGHSITAHGIIGGMSVHGGISAHGVVCDSGKGSIATNASW